MAEDVVCKQSALRRVRSRLVGLRASGQRRGSQPPAPTRSWRKVLGSLSVVFAVLAGLSFGSAGNPANAGTLPTPWSGSAVSPTPASSVVLPVSDGTAGSPGPAQFRYNYDPTPGVLATGVGVTVPQSWTFSTVADATGSVPLAYTYSGFHAFFEVRVGLKTFVQGSGMRTETPIISAGPKNNGQGTPSGGFSYAGTQSLCVQAGDTYGFVMTGSNFDENDVLQGTLTVDLATGPDPGAAACPATTTTTTTTTSTTTTSTTTTTIAPAPSGVAAGIVQAVGSGANTTVFGTVSGIANTTYNVKILGAATCTGGQLGSPSSVVGTIAVPLVDGSRYFVQPVTTAAPAVPPKFLALSVSVGSSAATAPSTCVARGADNDTWTRAVEISLSAPGPSGSETGYIDTAGGARWYKFPVQPGGKVQVDLTNLGANYDLALFTDIGKEFTDLNSLKDVTRLSAEFAPSVFSPSVFSPSVFSPSVFSPDAYSPSVFSPSVFSPSVFSPSVFSPSVFSPSVFSPSVFSPSVFSPSVFSPSVFSPSVFSATEFSPSVFSPNGVAPSVFSPETFSSAQTRSLIVNSTTPGTADESITADVWNNTGFFYARVSGRNGAFSTAKAFNLNVARNDLPACIPVVDSSVPSNTSVTAGGAKTLILMDSSRMPGTQTGNASTDLAGLRTRISAFSGKAEVAGVLVDLGADARVQALNSQADANPGCPYAKNLVAGAIKDLVGRFRSANPSLKYVVLVGPDGAIPFFRYPDQALLGPESDYVPPVRSTSSSEASLRLNYALGQDEYGSTTSLSLGADQFPLPDLAVGRLVETYKEATGMLDAYLSLTGGVTRTPTSAFVSGYDFLTDAATSVADDLAAGMNKQSGPGLAVDTLLAENNISPEDPRAWNATQLRTGLLGRKHDVVYLAGHFSANSALAADFKTTMLSTELAASATDFTNTLIFSGGCHSGYNIDDGDVIPGVTAPLDWAQAASRKQATLIAGTGYQYGDTDFVEYSERLYAGFAKQLRYGTGAVTIGEALVNAKRVYLKETPDPRGLHRKSIIVATLFGLPMMAINMPGGRLTEPADASVVGTTGTPVLAAPAGTPGAGLGLSSAELTVTGALTEKEVILTVVPPNTTGPTIKATYFRGPDGVVTNPAEPALPLISKNVSVGGRVLRGVGFRGGNYTDRTILPLTGAATTDLRGAHAPFSSPVFFPMRLATANYFDALAGGSTRLLVTPAQHRADPNSLFSTLRKYDNVNMRLFYSTNKDGQSATGAPALAAAPSLSGVSGAVEGADIVFRASVTGNPAAGVQQVWITYTGDGPERWQSIDLEQCVTPTLPAKCAREDSTKWVGRLVGGASVASNLRFMVQAANGVGLVTLDDALGAYYPVSGPAALVPVVPLASGLTLASPSAAAVGSSISVSATLQPPLNGKSVTFTIGSSVRTALTGNTGTPGVATATLPVSVLPGGATVRASFAGDDQYAASSASSPLTVTKSPTSLSLEVLSSATAVPSGVRAKLTDDTRGGAPLAQRTVYLTFSTTAGFSRTVTAITDYAGFATVSPLALQGGVYQVNAAFPGPGVREESYEPSTATAEIVIVAITGVTEGQKYILGAVPTVGCSVGDASIGQAPPCTVTVTGGNSNGVGSFTAKATATDKAGNTSTASVSYKVIYGWSGFEPPINPPSQGTSVFKAGSTAPVKFSLTRADGSAIQPLIAPLWSTPSRGGSTSLPVSESVYSLPGDSGIAFVPAGAGWRYNWKTDAARAGFYWRITVTADDGEERTIVVALR